MKTVLIVEDSQDYSEILKFTLTQKGYNVVTAVNGKEGVEKAISARPDLILMDVMMPDQDGAETALQIRSQQALAHVPIVFLTALTSGSKASDNVIMVQGAPYPAISKMVAQEDIVHKVGHYLFGK